MDISNTRLKELLNKYLEGTASAGEIREVDDWYRSFESHKGLTEQLSQQERTALERLLFSRISHDIAMAASETKVIKARNKYWWAAASIALLLVAGGIYFTVSRMQVKEVAKTMVTEKADKGNIKKIDLPDGSVIWLNADSKVSYASQYDRQIWLEGEGYFEIAAQQGNTFLVHTGKLDIRVLGTSFNIDAYAPADSVTVTVTSGKVAVGSNEHTDLTIAANQQAVYRTAIDEIKKYEINTADFGSWRDGQLIFKNISFQRIAQQLERRFNVRIRFDAPQTANVLLSARFGREETLQDILRMLCDIYGFSYKQENGSHEYLIYSDRSRQ